MDDRLTDVLAALRESALKLGARVYLVGGYVRDTLCGRPVKDVDCVLETGDPDLYLAEAAARLGWDPPLRFPAFGTAQIHGDGMIVEAVRARSESYRATSRKPEVVPGTLEQDVWRRDFTVNALLMTFDGEVIDLTGMGRNDLKKGILRTPLNAKATFRDDPLRMVRACRFASQLGYTFADGLLPAMRETAPVLKEAVVSVERITAELQLLLLTDAPSRGLRAMRDGGILDAILPELSAMTGVDQGGYHPDDVFDHTLDALDRSPARLAVRLGALFHDVGKPPTHVLADGRHTFHNHPSVGADIAKAALLRLRFSRDLAETVAALVKLHMRPIQYDPEHFSDAAVRRLIRDAADLRNDLIDLAIADTEASTYPTTKDLVELRSRMDRLDAQGTFSGLTTALDGDQLMSLTGTGPGPHLRALKRLLENAILDGDIPPHDPDAERAWLENHRAAWTGLVQQ